MVTVARAGLEARAVARAHHLFAGVGYEHELAGDDEHEFVLVRVKMPVARPRARFQRQQVHAELREAGGVAEARPCAALAGFVERRRITRPGSPGSSIEIDL